MMTNQQNPGVRRLAGALASFWEAGAGPSHGKLTSIFNYHGIQEHEDPEAPMPKHERVTNAVTQLAGDEQRLWGLIEDLVDALGRRGQLDDRHQDAPVGRDQRRLRQTLAKFGRDFTPEGLLTGGAVPRVASSSVQSVEVLREHIDRLHHAAGRDDPQAVVGSAKELIESTLAIVHDKCGLEWVDGTSLDAKAKQAEVALGLHQSNFDNNSPLERMSRDILKGLHSIGTTIVDFRNKFGTGHGRPAVVVGLTSRHAKMVAGAAIVYSEMLLDTLQDTDAPWRRGATDETRNGSI